MVAARFDPKRLGRIRLGLPKALGQIGQVIRDDRDLAIGDADELVGVRRLRVAPCLLVNAVGKLAIEILNGGGG